METFESWVDATLAERARQTGAATPSTAPGGVSRVSEGPRPPVRTAGFAEKVTFLTSNTADFCSGAARKLHEDFVPQFQDVAMEFVSDWLGAGRCGVRNGLVRSPVGLERSS